MQHIYVHLAELTGEMHRTLVSWEWSAMQNVLWISLILLTVLYCLYLP